jgi:hypothetical protein
VDQALADLESGIDEELNLLRRRLSPLESVIGRLVEQARPVTPVVLV